MPNYFLKALKRFLIYLGCYNQKSPQQIILDRLALEAKRLLQFTKKQNQEIAYELGFNESAHFSRFFKKMTDFSPTRYREKQAI